MQFIKDSRLISEQEWKNSILWIRNKFDNNLVEDKRQAMKLYLSFLHINANKELSRPPESRIPNFFVDLFLIASIKHSFINFIACLLSSTRLLSNLFLIHNMEFFHSCSDINLLSLMNCI